MKIILAFAMLAAMASGGFAQPVAKSVTLIIGFEAGGAYDIYARLFARHLQAHLAGQPNIVIQNMAGAGGLIAANYLYNVAPRDGSVIGVISQTAGIGEALGTAGVKYETRKFAWIGRISSNVQLLHSWRTSRAKTFADALTGEVIVAGTGPTSSSVVFPRIMNDLLGAKFRVVPGFRGSNSASLAMQQGEVDASVRPWSDIKAVNPDWLPTGMIYPLVQFSLKRAADLPNIPAIVDLAKRDEDRQLMGLFASGSDLGNSIAAPPGLPEATIAALREAMRAAMADPETIAEAKRLRLDLDPLDGAALADVVDGVFSVSPTVIAKAKHYNNGP